MMYRYQSVRGIEKKIKATDTGFITGSLTLAYKLKDLEELIELLKKLAVLLPVIYQAMPQKKQ